MKTRKIMLILFVILIVSGCQKQSSIEYVEKNLKIEISDGKVVNELNKEESFNGDGQKIIKININKDKFTDQLKNNKEWNTECNIIINTVLYGYEDENNSIAPIISEEDKPIIPKIKKGYYYFKDKNNASVNQNNLDYFEQYSYNFVVAVYDCKTSILYYCEYDS